MLQAVPGSTHGYDVVDPHRLNPELGGLSGYVALTERLRHVGLAQVLDIVPNHMALSSRDNRWWWDVLANGPSSRYARYFDIDWDSPERKLIGSVLVPILGDQYGRVLESGQLQVERDGGAFVVRYCEHVFPLSPRSIDGLLAAAAGRADSPPLAAIARAFGDLPHALISEPALAAERQRGSRILAERLRRLADDEKDVAEAIEAEVKAVNDDPDALDEVLRRQNYRLAFWRTASDELDYRRFFNIESLVGIRVEDPKVFDDTHGLILALVDGGLVDGVRVDHIDGLRDPTGYLDRLRDATGGVWDAVEKILAPDEQLPEEWPVVGTTGYEFLNRVNALFVDGDNLSELTASYTNFVGSELAYAEIVRDSKMRIMREELRAEVERLTAVWVLVCERHRRHRDYTRRELREGLREVLAAFGVYRTYVRPGSPIREADRQVIDRAIDAARDRQVDLDPQLFTFLGELLRLEHPGALEEELAARFQQLSSPVMAKGVEDTAFYRYHRLISLNEVGGSPDVVDDAVARFHAHNTAVAERWPATLVTLATHDTKRGPDARARINVLSEIPGPWRTALGGWAASNRRYRDDACLDANTEYLLYQTLVGAWPIDAARLGAFMEKATKEAKVQTSWTSPDRAYDASVQAFVAGVMNDAPFVASLERFLADEHITAAGRVNSLAQTALHLTAPGFADIYQGTELWDHSLVDPDNRRPVDYAVRRRLLAAVGSAGAAGNRGDDAAYRRPPPEVGDDGAAKLWLTQRLLVDRRDRPVAYRSGYRPLVATGADRDHVVAFWRSGGVVTVVPRLVRTSWGRAVDATVELPSGQWTSVLTASVFSGRVPVAELWSAFPVAVLAGSPS